MTLNCSRPQPRLPSWVHSYAKTPSHVTHCHWPGNLLFPKDTPNSTRGEDGHSCYGSLAFLHDLLDLGFSHGA